MDIQVNSLNYNFTNGSIDYAQVGLFGQDATSNDYVNAQIKVNQSDLAEGTTFLTANMAGIVMIAKKKLAADTAVKDATVITPAQ